MLAVVAGKYFTISLLVADAQAKLGGIQIDITEEDMIDVKSEEVAREWTAAKKQPTVNGRPVGLPGAELVPAVKAEGKRRWLVTKQADKDSQKAAEQVRLNAALKAVGGKVCGRAFDDMFRPIDALWFLFAAMGAFGIGSGARGE